jgi:hypothetical protein
VVLLVVFAKLCGQILASHGEVLWMAFWGFWWLFFYCYWLFVMARSVVALRVQVAVVANIGGG